MSPHTHFCSACYSHRGPKNRKGDRGWWKCYDTPCTRANTAACAYHKPIEDELLKRMQAKKAGIEDVR